VQVLPFDTAEACKLNHEGRDSRFRRTDTWSGATNELQQRWHLCRPAWAILAAQGVTNGHLQSRCRFVRTQLAIPLGDIAPPQFDATYPLGKRRPC
jgi:hypothetical protein